MPITDDNIKKAIEISRQFGVSKLVLFGSAVDDINSANDLDFAVEGITGWKLIELAAKLENELKINVDVVAIKPDDKFISHILNYAKVLYA